MTYFICYDTYKFNTIGETVVQWAQAPTQERPNASWSLHITVLHILLYNSPYLILSCIERWQKNELSRRIPPLPQFLPKPLYRTLELLKCLPIHCPCTSPQMHVQSIDYALMNEHRSLFKQYADIPWVNNSSWLGIKTWCTFLYMSGEVAPPWGNPIVNEMTNLSRLFRHKDAWSSDARDGLKVMCMVLRIEPSSFFVMALNKEPFFPPGSFFRLCCKWNNDHVSELERCFSNDILMKLWCG